MNTTNTASPTVILCVPVEIDPTEAQIATLKKVFKCGDVIHFLEVFRAEHIKSGTLCLMHSHPNEAWNSVLMRSRRGTPIITIHTPTHESLEFFIDRIGGQS